ncbi:MAG TPA: BTAD domain-containing putative transcriptional regulator [Mycobacterium sp.]
MTGSTPPGGHPQIGLLGPVFIRGRGGPLAIRGIKQQLLLAMLALSLGRTVSADLLVDTLWGDTPPSDAQTSLRGHIARLRDSLATAVPGPELVHRPPGYALDIVPECVDAVQFRVLLDAIVEPDPRITRSRLDLALSLWRGDPFGGLSENEQLRIEAHRLRELYVTALEDRADTLLRVGDHQAAISELEALVQAEPLREHRTRLLMTALYRDGRQAESLHAYANLRRILDTELGLEPSPELRETQRAVLEHDRSLLLAQAAESISALTTARTANLPWWIEKSLKTTMYGREPILAQLVDHVQRVNTADDPGPHVLLLHGEAGVGKSRLLAELARRAMGRGVRVLAGWCDPDGIIPFLPLVEALRPLVAEGSAQGWPTPVTLSAGRIVHDFTGTDRPRTDPETDRLRYFEGVVNLVHQASAYYPLLLAIDDIHWLDPSSAALLRHLLRQRVEHSFVLAGCYRDDESTNPVWSRVFDELRRMNICTQVELDELSLEATVRVLGDIVDETDQRRIRILAAKLRPITGGNPLFVREIADQLKAAGSDGDLHRELPLPTTLLGDVAGRLGHLSRGGREIVNLAAVLGAEFGLDELATVADETADRTLDLLEEARDLRLIDEVPNAIDRFAFRHALLREGVLHHMPLSRRRRAHLAAGAAYAMGNDMASTLARAFHLIEAVPVCPAETAARASIAAVDAALGRLAFEEAIRVLTRILDNGAPIEDATRFDLLLRLGHARAYRGETSASEAAYQDAATVARSLNDPIRLATAALGDDLDTRPLTPSPSRLELLDEALSAIDHTTPLGVAVASTYVALASLTTGTAGVQILSADTVAAARRTGDSGAVSKALLARLTCTNGTASPAERLAMSTEALELADSTGHPSRAARARVIRLGIALRLGRVDDAHTDHAAYRALAEATRVPRHLWHADVVAAALSRLHGEFADAQGYAERAQRTGERFGVAEAQMVHAVHLFFMHLHRGTLADFREAANAYATARPDLTSWTLSAALAARAAADLAPARRTLDEFIDRLPELDLDGEFTTGQLMQATELAHELNRGPVAADPLWRALAPRRGQFEVFGATTATLGPVDRALGCLAAQRGDAELAIELFNDAQRLCDRMRAWPWWVWTGTDLATQLDRSGRHTDAEAIIQRTAAKATEIGMTKPRSVDR